MRQWHIALFFAILCSFVYAAEDDHKENDAGKGPFLYLQPNTTQIFTEVYQAYGLLNPLSRTQFENALYLDQSTQPFILPMQPSDIGVFEHASQVLIEYHQRVNDLELYIDPKKPKPFFFTANGSKHLIVALVYAIAMSQPDKKFLFVEQAPFYSGHPNAVSDIFHYPNARFLPFHEPSEIQPKPGEILVEIVTSPNNPDGKFRKPLTNADIIIADFVFASSAFGTDGTGYVNKNIEWIRKAREAGKHLFSFNSASKQFGKTGTRCGYIWYPLYDQYAASIFKNFFNFISFSTVAGGTSGLSDFLNLIKALLDMPDKGKALREDVYKSLVKRHELVEKELLNRYPKATIISVPGSPTLFAKIPDPKGINKNASELLRKDFQVAVNSGKSMGETDEFIRLNLSGYSQILVEFLNRLAGKGKYTVNDLLFISSHICPSVKVCGRKTSNTIYVVNPGDCQVDADASQGPIEVILPPFMGYVEGPVVTIKKIDSSDMKVIVRSENFSESLKGPGNSLKVQWVQPLYQDGHWQVIAP